MGIEINTLQQILLLPLNDMLDLVDTVGHAAQLNTSLQLSKIDKIMVAYLMMNHAISLFEQCDCEININITNSKWEKPNTYNTDSGYSTHE